MNPSNSIDQETLTASPVSHSSRARASLSTRICAVLLLCFAVYYARSLLIPIVLALFAYLTLRPVLRFLRRRGLPHSAGAALIVTSLLMVLGTGVYTVYRPAQEMVASGPEYLETIKSRLDFLFDKINAVNEASDQLSDMGSDKEESAVSDAPVPVEVKQPAWSSNLFLISGTSTLLSGITVVVVMLFFLLSTGDQVLGSVVSSLPTMTARLEFMKMLENVEDGLSHYLGQVAVINACLGLAVSVAMWLLGMPSPIVWGVMAALLNFIPILGAAVGGLTVFLVAVVSFENAAWPLLVGSVFMILTTVEGQLITPGVLGRSMDLSPVMVMLSLLFWGWMWGIVGVFLAVPMLIVMRLVVEAIQKPPASAGVEELSAELEVDDSMPNDPATAAVEENDPEGAEGEFEHEVELATT